MTIFIRLSFQYWEKFDLRSVYPMISAIVNILCGSLNQRSWLRKLLTQCRGQPFRATLILYKSRVNLSQI